MYTDEQLDKLEQDEHSIAEEAIIAMLLLLANTKDELEKELRNFYQKYGRDGVVTYQEAQKWISEKNHRKRLTVLNILLATKFSNLFDDLTEEFNNFVKGVMKTESEFFKVDLDIDKLVLSDWGVDDSNWLDRLEEDVELWHANIRNDVKRSLLQRKNIKDVLKRLDERFTTMEGVIRNLGFTESTAVGSIARRQIFKELGITKYRFYTRPDERRCETCGSMHGLVFPISSYEVGVTASPIHPRCRCWEVPIKD